MTIIDNPRTEHTTRTYRDPTDPYTMILDCTEDCLACWSRRFDEWLEQHTTSPGVLVAR